MTHVIAKRKKGYFFCFRLWEESRRAASAPARFMLALAWVSRLRCQTGGPGIPSFAAAARQLLGMQVPCLRARGLLALEGKCPITATTKNKPVRWKVTAFGSGGVWAELAQG